MINVYRQTVHQLARRPSRLRCVTRQSRVLQPRQVWSNHTRPFSSCSPLQDNTKEGAPNIGINEKTVKILRKQLFGGLEDDWSLEKLHNLQNRMYIVR